MDRTRNEGHKLGKGYKERKRYQLLCDKKEPQYPCSEKHNISAAVGTGVEHCAHLTEFRFLFAKVFVFFLVAGIHSAETVKYFEQEKAV